MRGRFVHLPVLLGVEPCRFSVGFHAAASYYPARCFASATPTGDCFSGGHAVLFFTLSIGNTPLSCPSSRHLPVRAKASRATRDLRPLLQQRPGSRQSLPGGRFYFAFLRLERSLPHPLSKLMGACLSGARQLRCLPCRNRVLSLLPIGASVAVYRSRSVWFGAPPAIGPTGRADGDVDRITPPGSEPIVCSASYA